MDARLGRDGLRRVRVYRILDLVGGRLRAAMRRLGPFALMAGCATLVIIAPGLAAAQAGCDLPPHTPDETAAYRIIKDLLYANAAVDSAFIKRLEAQIRWDSLASDPTEVFVALEREARTAECAARLVEPFDPLLAKGYDAEARMARAFRKYLTSALTVLTDPTTPDTSFAKVNMAVRNFLANRRVEDEQDWKDRRQLSDNAATIAAIDPKCLTLRDPVACARDRLSLTRQERTWVLNALTAHPEAHLTRLRNLLESSVPSLDGD